MAGLLSKNSWFSESKHSEHQEDGESLLTVLSTAEDRSALTILIADVGELMRKQLQDTFSAESASIPLHKTPAKEDTEKLVLNPEVDVLQQGGGASTEQEKQDARRKAIERRQKEIAQPEVQELKKAALADLEEWRSAVIQRIGEIVNTRSTAESHKNSAKPREESKPAQTNVPVKVKETSVYDDSVARSLESLYPPVETSLAKLPEEKRALILHSVLLLLLSLESYSAYSRILLLRLTTSLRLPIDFLAKDETKIAHGLLTAAETLKGDEEQKKAAEGNKDSRAWKVGLATVAGAALIGITGGLAAPFVAAGLGTVMGGLGLGATAAAGYLGALAGSSVLVGGLFGAYGGAMTGQMMDAYAKEVEDFGFEPVRPAHFKDDKEQRRLRVAVGISGWLTNKQEVVAPWHVIGLGLETFALRWEVEQLMDLGNALTSMLTSTAWGYAKHEIIKRTIFATLYAGLWPLALLKVSRVIDNPWSVAHHRAAKAGEVLADALINKAQGKRPVTLVGYSLGAQVIYTCLQQLAARKAFGLIESVVLIGSPTPSDEADWRAIRAVVAGRVVNVYSSNDYILAFLYRSSSIQLGVAGLQAVEGVAGVENVDVSELVSGHTAYRFLTGAILRKLGFEDVDTAELEKEQEALKKEEAKQEKVEKEISHDDAEPQQGEVKQDHDDEHEEVLSSKIQMMDLDGSVESLEKDVQAKNDASKSATKSDSSHDAIDHRSSPNVKVT